MVAWEWEGWEGWEGWERGLGWGRPPRGDTLDPEGRGDMREDMRDDPLLRGERKEGGERALLPTVLVGDEKPMSTSISVAWVDPVD